MSQNAELAKVKLRIKAYLERTPDRGFTEAECLTAAEKLGELLEQYDINLSELDLAEESCVLKTYKVPGHNLNALGTIMVGVGRLTNSKIWYTHSFDPENFKDVINYNFFGLESDTDIALYLAETLNRTLNQETENFKKTDTYKNSRLHKRSTSTSFQRGFANRVYNRLLELAKQNEDYLKREAEERTNRLVEAARQVAISRENGEYGDAEVSVDPVQACRSLILVKLDKVEAEFSKRFGWKLGKGRGHSQSKDYSAYSAGQSAGNRANLNRPVGGSSQKLIGG